MEKETLDNVEGHPSCDFCALPVPAIFLRDGVRLFCDRRCAESYYDAENDLSD